jgi:hypothetical protein
MVNAYSLILINDQLKNFRFSPDLPKSDMRFVNFKNVFNKISIIMSFYSIHNIHLSLGIICYPSFSTVRHFHFLVRSP